MSAGNPLRIVPMADFQGKSPHGAENPKNGAILNYTFLEEHKYFYIPDFRPMIFEAFLIERNH